jgi:hypothetical protein
MVVVSLNPVITASVHSTAITMRATTAAAEVTISVMEVPTLQVVTGILVMLPITAAAPRLGTVQLKLEVSEGFHSSNALLHQGKLAY